MDDAPTYSDSLSTPPPPEPRRRRRWPWILLAAVVLLPVLIFGVWAGIALNWSYSSGDRVGYVLKFSKKGWLCKTWEGELSMATVPGVAPEKWTFTVRSDEVAKRIQAAQGQQVKLVYDQHKFIPHSCFGETEYFVSDVQPLGAAGQLVPAAPLPPGGAAPPVVVP